MINGLSIPCNQATSASGNVIAETAFGAASVRTLLTIPAGTPNAALDGKELVLRVQILITGGAATNYTPSVRLNSGANTNLTTFAGDTAIITPTAFAVNTVTRLWTMNARLNWDATTARLNGNYWHQIDTVYTAPVTLTAGLSAGVAAATSISWLVTGIFSATNGGNTAVLKTFEMDLV